MNIYIDAILYLKLIRAMRAISYRDDLYPQIPHDIYVLYIVYGAWMWAGASAELVIFEEEYVAWVVVSHLLTPIPCIITRNLFVRS